MNRTAYLLYFLLLFGLLSSCKSVKPRGDYSQGVTPQAPDYSNASSWASLPNKNDQADRTPKGFDNKQSKAEADVFFLHPTTYTGSKGEDQWNGPVDDKKLNKKTDKSTILFQASIFNGAGRVFAPRYRQAHIHSYFSGQKQSVQQAFELAYQDIKAAFAYYLEHYNEGRPIIIAAHSQGTTHAIPLLKEFFDGKKLVDQLVVAYLVGMPVDKSSFKEILPCESPEEIGCFCSWRSWERGHGPKIFGKNPNIVVTNPLTWTRDTALADKSLNQGTMLRKYGKIKPGIANAQIHQDLLWVDKPKFFWSFLLKIKNYHIADYNLFWVNIRKNAVDRVGTYQTSKIR